MMLPKNEHEFFVIIYILELLNLGIICSVVYFNFRSGLKAIGNRRVNDLLQVIPVALLAISGALFHFAGLQGVLWSIALDIFSCLIVSITKKITNAEQARFERIEASIEKNNKTKTGP